MENRRINKVRKKFNDFGISAFLVTDITNIRYLTGLKLKEEGDARLLITQDNYYLITDGRYQEQAQNQIKDGEVIITRTSKEKNERPAALIKMQDGKTGFEAENLTVAELQALERELVNSAISDIVCKEYLCPIKNLIEDISSIKDQGEIRKIRKAVEITEHIFQEHLLGLIRPGIKEIELAAKITYLGKEHGAEDDAFDPIVLFGSNSSFPHGDPPKIKSLKRGNIIQFDFGYFYRGYCSDFSRVVIVGKPTEEQKKIHQILLEAQKRAIDAIKPGMKANELDKIARDFIKENGYEFVHGLGHGIGIKIHTKPHISLLVEKEEIIKPGQVFTIEPGIYIENWGGMRIEDDVLVTKDSCEVLTKFSRDLIVI